MPEHRDCCGQGWDTGAGIKEEHRLAEVALRAPELVPLPTREQPVSARVCLVCGAAKSSLTCTDQDLPAGSACSLLLNPGKTVNHTKSDTEIHTYTHADINIYHLCIKHKQNRLLLYIFEHFCFGYYPAKHLLCWKTSQPFFSFYYRGHRFTSA